MQKPVRVFSVGFGSWALDRTVLPLVKEKSDLAEIVSVGNLKKGKADFDKVSTAFINKGVQPPMYIADYKDSLTRDKFDAVVINLPNAQHVPVAEYALRQGLHVYVERPIATQKDDLSKLIMLAKKNNCLLFTGVQRRLEPSYQYLRESARNKFHFEELSNIRCCLASGWPPSGWRTDPELAVGGIVLDNGYHLLDAVAWILEGARIEVADNLNGTVCFSKYYGNSSIETTAIGYLKIGKVLLSFDFTYDCPRNSIYERIDITDSDGRRITLCRDQAIRSPAPATITHQNQDGQLVEAEIGDNSKVIMHNAQLPGGANNTGPLLSFLEAIQSEKKLEDVEQYECYAERSLSTWRIVRRIYQLAK